MSNTQNYTYTGFEDDSSNIFENQSLQNCTQTLILNYYN